MRPILFILAFVLCNPSVWSQIEIDKSIIFKSENTNLNNIDSVSIPNNKTNGISIKTGVENPLPYSNAISTTLDVIDITTSITPLSITEGMIVRFTSPISNTSNVKINVNGSGNYSLLKYGTIELEQDDLSSGVIIEAIFDGSNFQILSMTNESFSCPVGYENINGEYCIQSSANAELSWFDAVKYCMDREAKLCSWSEFGEACEILNGGGTDYTDAWEWVNTTGDHHVGARVVGFGGCEEGDSENAELKVHKFRCCIR